MPHCRMIPKKPNKRSSFALTEVLIAFSLFLLFSPLLFNAMNSTARSYQTLNQSLQAHTMAEEALCDYVSAFMLQPPPFDSLEEAELFQEPHEPFTVERTRSRIEGDENVALIQLSATVLVNDEQLASRSVKLCVKK